jgi:hypothetical protein
MKLEFPQKIFIKSSNTKSHDNLYSGAKLFNPDGQTDRQINITKLTVAFCNVAKEPNSVCIRFTVSVLFVPARVTTQKPLSFVEYDMEPFYRDCATHYKFWLNCAVMTGTLHANLHTLLLAC